MSLLAFDPDDKTFAEHALLEVGVPDRIYVHPDGQLWLTIAHDAASGQEYTKIALFDPATHVTQIVPKQASSLAFDPQGETIAGSADLVNFDPTGKLESRRQLPHPLSVDDLMLSLGNGTLVITDKANSGVMVNEPGSNRWTVYKLETAAGPISAPPGYEGPAIREATAQINDMHADSQGNVWLLNANYNRFVKLRP
jgi:sugar lactone lactonase YvrE